MTGMTRAAGQIESVRAARDVSADTNPGSEFWRGIPAIHAESGFDGNPVPAYRMQVRSRWTEHNLYLLFICPYEELNLKPDPRTDMETNQLWNWAVAEAFIGSDFTNIRRYKEFEVSPQAEWVDLDIDLDLPHPADGWVWNSGVQAAARVDARAKIWYAFMRIPYASFDTRMAKAGNTLRVNFFLSEGAHPNHQEIAWQATHQPTFHVPDVFGTMLLVDAPHPSHPPSTQ